MKDLSQLTKSERDLLNFHSKLIEFNEKYLGFFQLSFGILIGFGIGCFALGRPLNVEQITGILYLIEFIFTVAFFIALTQKMSYIIRQAIDTGQVSKIKESRRFYFGFLAILKKHHRAIKVLERICWGAAVLWVVGVLAKLSPMADLYILTPSIMAITVVFSFLYVNSRSAFLLDKISLDK